MNMYEDEKLETIIGETLRPGGLELTEEALDFCSFSPGASILDVGCGTGATVRHLIESRGFNALGIDSSEKMIHRGKSKYPKLPLILGSGDNMPIRSGIMDAVLMECSFSLIKDPGFALTESYRVLREKGKLIISDFYYRNRPGVWTKEIILGMLEEQGFILEQWRDRTSQLGQMVVDCIMSDGCTETLWCCLLSKDENRGLTREQLQELKPGYFLLIADKADEPSEHGEGCSHDHDTCGGDCG